MNSKHGGDKGPYVIFSLNYFSHIKSHLFMEDKNINNQYVELKTVTIGDFTFNTVTGQLSSDLTSVQLEPQVKALLTYLIERAGELVSKEDLYNRLWENRVVSDEAFRAVIKKLRKALSDDARSPNYLQTVPLKGYRLIAPISNKELNAKKQSSIKKSVNKVLVIGLTGLVLVISLININSVSYKPEPELLTNMDGSELRQSYNAEINQLVFSHRQNKDDYLQLYTKSLDSGSTKRLTFDDANYSNGHLSPDGKRIAYTRSTPKTSTTFIADFSPIKGVSNISALPTEIGKGRYLQAWNASGDGLYLSDLHPQEFTKGISFYDLNTKTLSQLTHPTGLGRGDIFARESNNGKYLAILRNLSVNEFELIIQHLVSGELTHVVKLPTRYTQLVWNLTDSEILLSSFYSDFARYSLSNKVFEMLDIETSNVNDIFYSCGSKCFYARQHDGNYLDLDFQPNPFSSQIVAFETHVESEGAESFPIFGSQTSSIYFVNKQGKETQIVRSLNGHLDVLTRFPIDATIVALQVNADETKVSGVIDNRLFFIDLASSDLTYLSTELEVIVTTYWHPYDDALYFSRIEKDHPVLYRYEFSEKIKIREAEKRFAQFSLAQELTLVVDEKLTVWIESIGQEPRKIAQLTHHSPNRWRVNNNNLYYTTRSENLTYLNRTDLNSGKTETKLWARNRYQIQFDIAKDGISMIGVRSILAQSNTVKIQY